MEVFPTPGQEEGGRGTEMETPDPGDSRGPREAGDLGLEQGPAGSQHHS